MKTDEEILSESGIVPSREPDEYNYPNSALFSIKNACYLEGYKKALADLEKSK